MFRHGPFFNHSYAFKRMIVLKEDRTMKYLINRRNKLLSKKRNAFTIVELVIVIAVIGVLAAILIPTFISLVDKVNAAGDQAAAKNMNTALKVAEADNNKPETMYEALEIIEAAGYKVENLTPSTKGYNYFWDQTDNQILYCKPDGSISYPSGASAEKWETWAIVHKADDLTSFAGRSIYLGDEYEYSSAITVAAGIDVGNHENIAEINYVNSTSVAQNVIIRTNGGALTVNAPLDVVRHYGDAITINIVAVASSSYHEYGMIQNMSVTSGNVELMKGSEINTLSINPTNVTVEQEQGATLGSISSDDGTELPSTRTSTLTPTLITSYITALTDITSTGNYVLKNDVTATAALIIANEQVKIDMNGYNISFPTCTKGNELFSVSTNGIFELANSKGTNGTVTVNKSVGSYVIYEYNDQNASVVIGKNVTFDCSYGVGVMANDSLTVYGKIYSTGFQCIIGNGTAHGTTINLMPGSEIKSNKMAIYHPQRGTLNINGALVEGYAAIGMKSGTINISNGSMIRGIVNDSVLTDANSNGNGISNDGSAIVIDTYAGYDGNMIINVSDSTIESYYSYAIKEIQSSAMTKSNVASVRISGDSIIQACKTATSENVTSVISLKIASSLTVLGGKFYLGSVDKTSSYIGA